MYEFHKDKDLYFNIQTENARSFVIPFVEESLPYACEKIRVLEVGCGEGGVLKAFLDKKCICVGVELNSEKYKQACKYLEESLTKENLKLIHKNIHHTTEQELGGKFDLIILKDAIEHLHDKTTFMRYISTLLTDRGVVFFGFPPWQMPYGGHQQMCKSKIGQMPYIHLLPTFIYRWILRSAKEDEEQIDDLMDVVKTRVSIEQFVRLCHKTDYKIRHKRFYLINPIYRWKFNLTPRQQFRFISAIPFFRNFVTTCVYYLVEAKTK